LPLIKPAQNSWFELNLTWLTEGTSYTADFTQQRRSVSAALKQLTREGHIATEYALVIVKDVNARATTAEQWTIAAASPATQI